MSRRGTRRGAKSAGAGPDVGGPHQHRSLRRFSRSRCSLRARRDQHHSPRELFVRCRIDVLAARLDGCRRHRTSRRVLARRRLRGCERKSGRLARRARRLEVALVRRARRRHWVPRAATPPFPVTETLGTSSGRPRSACPSPERSMCPSFSRSIPSPDTTQPRSNTPPIVVMAYEAGLASTAALENGRANTMPSSPAGRTRSPGTRFAFD